MSKSTETDTFRKLNAAMKNIDGDTKQIMKGMQAQIEYLMTKCKAWEETATELNNGKAVTLSDDRKKRIAGLFHGYRREPLAA